MNLTLQYHLASLSKNNNSNTIDRRSKTTYTPVPTKSSDFVKMKVSHFESSNTLQNSIRNVFFSKEERFQKIDKDGKTDKFYNTKKPKTERSAGFGYGNRKPIIIEKEGPSPNAYNIYSCFENNVNNKKGTTLSSRLETEPNARYKLPGPGSYFNSSINNDTKSGYSIVGKNGTFFDSLAKSGTKISPQNYKIKYEMVENGRFNGVAMGIGEKSTMKHTSTPGVGSYNLPSCFDSKKKNTYALN